MGFRACIEVGTRDEYVYKEPDWFWDNLDRFDSYDRTASKVYLGEYAAHNIERRSTLRSALADAAYMTALERNGDVVRLASYAPLLAKQHHVHWAPDLIYFDTATSSPTINYHVQRLFSANSGDRYLPTSVNSGNSARTLDLDTWIMTPDGNVPTGRRPSMLDPTDALGIKVITPSNVCWHRQSMPVSERP